MELMEFDFRVYDGSCKPFSLPTGVMEPPWFPLWMSFCNMAVRQRGGTPDAANMLYSWTLRHPAFEDVVYEEHFVPTAPFMSSEEPNYHLMRTISEIFREDILVCDQEYRHLTANSPSAVLRRRFLGPVGHFYWGVGSRNLSLTNSSIAHVWSSRKHARSVIFA